MISSCSTNREKLWHDTNHVYFYYHHYHWLVILGKQGLIIVDGKVSSTFYCLIKRKAYQNIMRSKSHWTIKQKYFIYSHKFCYPVQPFYRLLLFIRVIGKIEHGFSSLVVRLPWFLTVIFINFSVIFLANRKLLDTMIMIRSSIPIAGWYYW